VLLVGAAEAIDVTTVAAVDISNKLGKESHHSRLQPLARFQQAKILLLFRLLLLKYFVILLKKTQNRPKYNRADNNLIICLTISIIIDTKPFKI
jgi:hypothetical protein